MYYFPINPKISSEKLLSYFNCDAKPPWQYSYYKYWGYPLQRDKNGPVDFPLLYSVGEIIKANIYQIDSQFKMDIPDMKLILLVTSNRKILKLDPGIPMFIKNFPILGGAVYYIKDGIANILYMATHPLCKGGGTVLINNFKRNFRIITLDTLKESENFYLKNGFRRIKSKIYKELVWKLEWHR